MKKIILSFLVAVSAMLSVSEAMAYDIWYVNGSDGRMYVRSSTDPATGTGSPRTASQVADTFSFSPDNQYIVYPKGYSSTRCYRRSVSDTSTSQDGTQVTSQTCYQPTYSPDGQYIVYVGPSNILYRKTASGTDNGTAITTVSGGSPQVSKDSTSVYYIDSSGNIRLKSILDNGTGSIIATNANSTYRGMSLSPDGNTLVYTSKYSDSQEKLVKKLSYDSNNGTPITTVGGYHPAWSPDGLSLNYEQLSAGIPRLYNKDLTSSNGSAIAPTNTRLSRSYFQTASCSDGIQNQDETAVDFGGVCGTTTQVCYSGATATGAIVTFPIDWGSLVTSETVDTTSVFSTPGHTIDYGPNDGIFTHDRPYVLDFGGSITTSMTGTYNASSNYWNVINTTGTFGSTFFQPYMEVQTSQYNSTGAVYIPSSSFSSGSLLGQTVVQGPGAIGDNAFSYFKVNGTGSNDTFTFEYDAIQKDFDNKNVVVHLVDSVVHSVNQYVYLPYPTHKLRINFKQGANYTIFGYNFPSGASTANCSLYGRCTLELGFWIQPYSVSQQCQHYNTADLNAFSGSMMDGVGMSNAINDIAIKQAQTKALQDQFGFSNPLLSPFINALKGLADRFGFTTIVNFLSVYVPAQPVLTLDTFPRFTISGGKINLTASSITLTPISPGAGITSPLGTGFSSTDCTGSGCVIATSNYKAGTAVSLFFVLMYIGFWTMMVAILFSGFDFVNDFVQGIVERIFGGSGSIDNVSGNIWVFASGIAYWVYMTGLFITISLMLAFILPFLVVVKNYLLVGISLCIMSFVGASGWENFQFYTNFLISSVLIGVPLYALFFVLTKWGHIS